MTTPAPPNPLALTNVQSEFGGTSPISLTEYYANGTDVPIGLGPASSGAITMSSLRGLTNYSTLQKTQSGISTSTGTVVGYWTPNLNGYGPYPTRTLDSLTWTTTFITGSLTVYQYAYIDYGYNIFIAVNGVWNTTAICSVVHGGSGAGYASGTTTVPYSIPAGATVQFGFSTGPYWQQVLSSGVCTVTFNRA